MDYLLNRLETLKYSKETFELYDSSGFAHTIVFVYEYMTSAFVDEGSFSGNIHYARERGWEHLQIHKKSNKGRWTPRQRQQLEALGFTVDYDYATRRNAP